VGYWAAATAAVEEEVPMAATVVEFREPAAAQDHPAADFLVAAEASGCRVGGSAVTGRAATVLARRWSVRA
jgi:lysozyme family protein